MKYNRLSLTPATELPDTVLDQLDTIESDIDVLKMLLTNRTYS